MSLIWIWYKLTNNPSVVDVGWASCLTMCGCIYLYTNHLNLRTILLGSLLLLWGLRLGGYLYWTRIRNKQIDKRYNAISEDWKKNIDLRFFINFQLQGIFVFLVSISWYFISISNSDSVSLFDCIGILVFVCALILESISDLQLQNFKKQNPGKVCNTKLWRFSRHPNCLFEWIVWCSFASLGIASHYGILSLISPITLYCIMVYLTIPITEAESIKSRGSNYINYQKVTPKFFLKL